MKRCPQCDREYPDSEGFCEVDGTALAGSGGGFGRSTQVIDDSESGEAQGGVIECPVCGGKAQPGEIICNFCGTRLAPDSEAETGTYASAQTPRPPQRSESSAEPMRRQGPVEIGTLSDAALPDEPTSGRRAVGVVGFVTAAIVALAAGAWLAIYLSGKHQAEKPVAAASPSPAAVSGPQVALARTVPIQVLGDLASAMQRDKDSVRKVFDENRGGLVDVYRHALESDATLHDGMLVRLHINPDGSVTNAAVRVSTSPDPSLDADVVKAVSGWKFTPAKGSGVDAEYPVVFATGSSDVASIEGDLSTKLASIGPNETAEYAVTPSTGSASAIGEAAATPAAPPAVVSAPPAEAAPSEAVAPPHKHRPRMVASARPPEHMRKPPLADRVMAELKANRKLRRVQVYTNGGTVNLSGKVFNDDDKLLAVRTVRGVDGVTGVVDNLTTDMQEWAQNQARISQQLQNAGLDGVTVKVIGHDAYLNGQVKTDLDRERAVTIAQAAAPVKVRENLIRVAPGNMFGF